MIIDNHRHGQTTFVSTNHWQFDYVQTAGKSVTNQMWLRSVFFFMNSTNQVESDLECFAMSFLYYTVYNFLLLKSDKFTNIKWTNLTNKQQNYKRLQHLTVLESWKSKCKGKITRLHKKSLKKIRNSCHFCVTLDSCHLTFVTIWADGSHSKEFFDHSRFAFKSNYLCPSLANFPQE